MSRPQVTITLGRSGQKVVKRSSVSQGNGFSQQTSLSRGKRLLGETYRTGTEDPSRKRVRGGKDSGGSRYGRQNDARVGQNDLRLKLMHRRRQKEILLQVEKRKREQYKRMTGNVQSVEQYHRRLVTSSQLLSRSSELLQKEAIRPSYASQDVGVRPRSPNRLAKYSREVASSRNITTAQHVRSVRPAETSRMACILGNDVINPSHLKGLTPVTMRSALAARNPLSGLPFANGSMLQSSYPVQPPVSVASLLNSLGLGKYAIHFQAEEVDMAALKQMGDRDLKELGIPMGPRKKILQAMPSLMKRIV